MDAEDKFLVWLHGEVKTPPIGTNARLEIGFLLRRLQQGEVLSLPHARPMPSIGKQCGELRVNDKQTTWRLIYRIDDDAIIITDVFAKKTQKTPQHIISASKKRLQKYDELMGKL